MRIFGLRKRGAGAAAATFALALAMAVALAASPDEAFKWNIPSWAPRPVAPADNPMTEAKVELGRHLFYDRRLSRDGSMACATCHQQSKAFTDGLAAPVGVTGERHPRGAMSLTNVGYLPVLTWANPNMTRLELQALVPMFGAHPVEMGMAGREQELFERLRSDPRYPPLFDAAFPDEKDRVSLATITRALATFQRTLISLDSPYDRFRYGHDPNAISAAAKRGEALFFSEKFECYHCHAGFTFTDNVRHSRLAFPETGFHNNALYNVDGWGGYPEGNQGLIEFTKRPEDMGKFRTPTLRNIALTAPYMHDGSLATLADVLRHYAEGGRTIHAGPHKGKGSENSYKSNFIVGFKLSDSELADMVAFLESLTDERFVTDPRFSDPFAERPAASGKTFDRASRDLIVQTIRTWIGRLPPIASLIPVREARGVESDPLPVPKGTSREQAVSLYNDGVVLMLGKKYDAAREKFAAALAQHEPFAEAHNNLAFSLRVLGRANHDRSLAHYNRAIELKPDLHVAYMYRGALHVLRGDLSSARADHARLVNASPELAARLLRVIETGADSDDYHGLAAQYD